MQCSICGAAAEETQDHYGNTVFQCTEGNHIGTPQGDFAPVEDGVKASDMTFGLTRRRAVIQMQFEVCLDMLPGWGHTIEDWIELAKSRGIMEQKHYDPSCQVLGQHVEMVPTVLVCKEDLG